MVLSGKFSVVLRSKEAESHPLFGALDLGTNNCRLLIARADDGKLKVVDAFSRIVRLGEGLAISGSLNEYAIERTLDALRVCNNKLKWHGVTHSRLVATEACRSASNGLEFAKRVVDELGIDLEIIDRATEARLAAAGAEPLIDRNFETALVFDIGGGSTEVMWVEREDKHYRLAHWSSLPVGVVTLSEQFGGGKHVDDVIYAGMCAFVKGLLAPFVAELKQAFGEIPPSNLLGTSGTVTTIAGVHLGLRHYDRSQVDGCWLATSDVDRAIAMLRRMSYDERARFGCIGKERADLVLAGCAILDEVMRAFPSDKIRVADRGLREGILADLVKTHELGGRAA
jgi:exopolyphosphatase / guanosine-5'-triphosphate,3'-diphosphate pyrophosphatase